MYETNTNMPIISHAELHSFFVCIRRTCFSKIQSRIISLLIQEQKKEILSAQLQKPLAIYVCICGPKICVFVLSLTGNHSFHLWLYTLFWLIGPTSNTNVKGNINEDSILTILYHHNIIWHVLYSLITSF